MKKICLVIIAFVLFGTIGTAEAQATKTPMGGKTKELIAPAKTTSVEAQAKELTKQGWKASQYTIESQLSYTHSLMCAVDSISGEPKYLWVQKEETADNKTEALSRAERVCTENITYQYASLILGCCREALSKKGATELQSSTLIEALNEVIGVTTRTQISKTMEITKEKDGKATVRVVMMLDKTSANRTLRGRVMAKLKDSSDAQFYQSILSDVFSPKAHRLVPKPQQAEKKSK